MTEAERVAWAAFEAGIVEDAVAAGLIDSAEDVAQMEVGLMAAPPLWWVRSQDKLAVRTYVEAALAQWDHTIMDNGDGTWNHTFTAKERD